MNLTIDFDNYGNYCLVDYSKKLNGSIACNILHDLFHFQGFNFHFGNLQIINITNQNIILIVSSFISSKLYIGKNIENSYVSHNKYD